MEEFRAALETGDGGEEVHAAAVLRLLEDERVLFYGEAALLVRQRRRRGGAAPAGGGGGAAAPAAAAFSALDTFAYGTRGDLSAEAAAVLSAPALHKLQMLSLLTACARAVEVAYDAAAAAAACVADDAALEALWIDCVYRGLARGRLDARGRRVLVEWVAGRDVHPDAVASLADALRLCAARAAAAVAEADAAIAAVSSSSAAAAACGGAAPALSAAGIAVAAAAALARPPAPVHADPSSSMAAVAPTRKRLQRVDGGLA